MAFDVEAAKADGYTDDEIQQYLATKDQPLPSEQPRDRTEEAVGTWTSAIPNAVKYGLEGAGLYAGGKAIANAIGNRGAPMTPPAPPAAPTTFTGGAAPAWDSALSKPYTPPAPSVPPAPPSNANYMQRMTQLADRYLPAAKQAASTVGRAVAPVARVLGSAPVMGAQLMAHSTDLGPQVPSAGFARGSELNPRTGRPWTAQELQAYNAQYR